MSTAPEARHAQEPAEPHPRREEPVDAHRRREEPVDAHRRREEPADPHRRQLAREKEAFGGMKLGSGFFGWLAATGTAALLLAVAAAAGFGAGAARSSGVEDAAEEASQNLASVATAGGIVLLVVLFVAYFCGGYVAGRMARLDGVKQGLAVWLWAVIFAVVGGVLVAVAGDRFDLGAQLDDLGLPIAVDEGTIAGLVGLLAVALVTLLGAVLGGRAGMHYHRKLDRAGHHYPATR
ncbi:hypothetical protein [Georgenia sp. EYE_87]|uniref:hypothetical protein n=1 Tax=Georgenia sp. EYE_87 TaxID=2853448 RepID=UPI002005FCEC|nr:hypothetical protein [Georgenia sp. EYE_87]